MKCSLDTSNFLEEISSLFLGKTDPELWVHGVLDLPGFYLKAGGEGQPVSGAFPPERRAPVVPTGSGHQLPVFLGQRGG